MTHAKLQTVEEHWDLFNDIDRLKEYRYSQPIVSDCGINNEEFHLELPYDEIKEIVERCRDEFMNNVPVEEKSGLRWEHVGSTSIKGMPGAKMPDALLILPEFPPSKGVIKALLDSGYYYSSTGLDLGDLWFFLVFTEGLLKDHKLTVHVATENNKAALMLLDMRDMCRNEEWAFNDYRDAKLDGIKGGKWMEYKMKKGKNSKLIQMLREKHGFIKK